MADLALIVLLSAAIVPPVFIGVMIYRMNEFQFIPFWLLVKLFLLAGASIPFVAFLESVGANMIDGLFLSEVTYSFIECFFIVAVLEESAKFLVLKFCTWNSPDFNYTFDAVVYAAVVALGFACFENIMYVTQYGLMNAVVRAISSIPLHAACGILIGCGYGNAKRFDLAGYSAQSTIRQIIWLVFAVLVHGFYDFCLSVTDELPVFFVIFIIFVLFIYILTFIILRAFNNDDHHILEDLE